MYAKLAAANEVNLKLFVLVAVGPVQANRDSSTNLTIVFRRTGR
jgi:hypothetical protein